MAGACLLQIQCRQPWPDHFAVHCHSGRVEHVAWCSLQCRFNCLSSWQLLALTLLIGAYQYWLLAVSATPCRLFSCFRCRRRLWCLHRQERWDMLSKSLAPAPICECHALLPVFVLLLPQASLVPAASKALEHAEHKCGALHTRHRLLIHALPLQCLPLQAL